MQDDVIYVKNRLEVRPGMVLSVPGCEPTSSLTSTGLLKNLDCKASVIDVKLALKLIKGSKLIRTMVPVGSYATGLAFELPSGPSPDGNTCPQDCLTDWYKLLRRHAKTEEHEKDPKCSGYNFTGCQLDQDNFHRAPNPDLRPNGNSLNIGGA